MLTQIIGGDDFQLASWFDNGGDTFPIVKVDQSADVDR